MAPTGDLKRPPHPCGKVLKVAKKPLPRIETSLRK